MFADPKLIMIVVAYFVVLGIFGYKTVRDPRFLKFKMGFVALSLGMIGIGILYEWIRFGF